MSEETVEQQQRFESRDSDRGVDLSDLPGPPWTPAAIGDLFYTLADICGAGDLRTARNPALDPRSFGAGRAKRLIRLMDATGEEAEALLAEGAALQAMIDATLPQPAGTPRQGGAPPLRPAKTVKRTRTF